MKKRERLKYCKQLIADLQADGSYDIIDGADETLEYPYGLPCASTSPTANAYKFGGKEMETRYALNFTHHGARLYFPDLGRFASPDPLARENPQTATYLYCGANPVNLIDPTGLKWVNEEKVEMFKHRIKAAISRHTTAMESHNEGSKAYKGHNLAITRLNDCLTEINNIANDKQTYELSSAKDKAHKVKTNGKRIFIEGPEDELYIHETTHIKQVRDEKKGISDGFNKNGQMLNPGNGTYEKAQNEIEAYQAQYAMNPDSLPNAPSDISEINATYLLSIPAPGLKFLRDFHKQMQNNFELEKSGLITINPSDLKIYNDLFSE